MKEFNIKKYSCVNIGSLQLPICISIENITDDEFNKIIQDSQVVDEAGKPTFKLYDNLDDSKVKEKIKENGKKLKDIATATINVHNQHLELYLSKKLNHKVH